MAEALFQVVLEDLISLMKTEIVLILGVDEEMKKLCNTLTTIQAVLEDAELKQIEDLPIQDWLRKVNAVAYEIDDILDDCNTHISKLNKAGKTLSRYSLNSIAIKLLHRSEIAKRIKQVNAELDAIDSDRKRFHLREMQVDRSREVAASARETCSLMNDPDTIYGRIEDTDEIVKMLVEDVSENQQLSVLPIIGVGGLGKTTLAQLVFNHPRVVKHFEKRIWVCVSDDFDIKTLVKAMIESAGGTGRAADMQHLDAPVHYLRELLSQKRYLIVLDDVWNEHQEKWYKLKDILSCGSTGASIIVTTRLKKVADIMGTLPPHYLKGLSDEHCWMLLRQRAFGKAEEYPELEVIGKQIMKKCAGVPLAAKALGGILRFKRTEEEWIYVRESEIWKLPQDDCSIMPVLRLSYHHLPLELRQCFAYFAAFPKDYKVGKEELIRLWMAHGFISSKGILQVEDVGNEICNELIPRSFLQPNHDYNHSMSMHDLVHDLAQLVMESRVPGKQIQRNVTSASTVREVNLLYRNVMFPKTFQQDMDISSILKLKCLRVVDASSTWIQKLPHSIGNLKHLRYLNLRSSQIRTLPNSLCTLWNLETLDLFNCYRLVALPKKIKNLRNLRHLSLKHCKLLSEMPSKMSKLTHLKTLSMFVVGHKKGNKLEELQCLNLSGRLEIRHLERVKNHLDAKQANIVEKKNLRDLSLSWERDNVAKSGEEDVDEKVLEALEPHPNLEEFTVSGYRGRHFPVWMTNSTLTKIVRMEIKNCINCRRLPKLGELPHLRSLLLTRVGVEYIIDEEVGSGNQGMVQFLALKDLFLYNLPNLKGLSREQECKDAFPNLKRLSILNCSSSVLPPISSLRKLEDLHCSSSILPLFSELNTLTELYVMVEKDIACFPIETLMKFTNLQTLTIRGAKEISVTEEGLQALKKLQRLKIQDCETMTCIPEGMLRHLTALQSLLVWSCPEFVELPEGIKDLHNLQFISLIELPKMACLPEALQHLSSLTRLHLSCLPQLESISILLYQLTSLQIDECDKIVSIPALPNLKELTIRQCPQLERRCRRDDWHKIALIPYLLIVS